MLNLAERASTAIDSIPGAKTAVTLLDWGLWIAGGPAKMALSSVVSRVSDQATQKLTGRFATAGYNQSDALSGGVGGIVLLSALGVGISKALGLAETSIARAGRLGREGEIAAGIRGSKLGIKINGRMRFPDEITQTTVKEIKNVARQGWTRQLRDYADLARQRRIPFELWVRKNTQISRHLRDAELRGEVIIHKRLPKQ